MSHRRPTFRLTDDQRQLAEDHLDLVPYTLAGLVRLSPSLLELAREAATDELLWTAHRWRPELGVPFRPFAWPRLRWRAWRALEAARGHPAEVELVRDDLVARNDPGPTAGIEAEDLAGFALSVLPERWARVAWMALGRGLRHGQVAAALGLSRSRVQQIVTASLDSMRRVLA